MIQIGILEPIQFVDYYEITKLINREYGNNYKFNTYRDFSTAGSVIQATWGMINLVDIVIANVSIESNDIFYEIGLAHGIGKPVIIITDNEMCLPKSLLSQRIISIENNYFSRENLTFRIMETINDIVKKGRSPIGYTGPRERMEDPPISSSRNDIQGEFKTLFAFEGRARSLRFERWFENVASQVIGWEVISNKNSPHNPNGFDVVMWNSREDGELRALGNPIPIELKSIQRMSSSILEKLFIQLKNSGLRSVVLATTGTVSDVVHRKFLKLSHNFDVRAIYLDRDDLSSIQVPEDLIYLFNKKLSELLYGEKF